MERDSTLQTSPDSRISFPAESFRPLPSLLALLGMVAFIGLAAIAGILVYITSGHISLAALAHPKIGFALVLQVLIDLCVVLYLAIVLPAISKLSLRDLGFTVPRARDVGIALLGAIAMIVVVNGLGSIIDAALHSKHQQEQITLFLNVRDPLVKLLFAGLAVLVAPIAEEFAFRVFIFNVVRRWSGFWPGALVSGILFGFAHMDPYAMVPLIFGGMILCAVYARSGNAWSSMITHAIFNSVSLIALFAAPQLAK